MNISDSDLRKLAYEQDASFKKLNNLKRALVLGGVTFKDSDMGNTFFNELLSLELHMRVQKGLIRRD